MLLAITLAAVVLTFSGDESGQFGFSDRVQVVDVEGELVESRLILEQLKRYEDSNSVKAILLNVDSPGGGVAVSQEIYAEIKRLRDVFERSALGGLHNGLHCSSTRHEDYRTGGITGAGGPQPIEPGVLIDINVRDHDRVGSLAEAVHGLLRRCDRFHIVLFEFEERSKRLPDRPVIFNDKQTWHVTFSLLEQAYWAVPC